MSFRRIDKEQNKANDLGERIAKRTTRKRHGPYAWTKKAGTYDLTEGYRVLVLPSRRPH